MSPTAAPNATAEPARIVSVAFGSHPIDPTHPQGYDVLQKTIEQYGLKSDLIRSSNLATQDDKGWADRIQTDVTSGRPLIALIGINIATHHGLISNRAPLIGHFAVIVGVSTSWDSDHTNSDWLKVLNPFNNEYEYYRLDGFLESMRDNSPASGGFLLSVYHP